MRIVFVITRADLIGGANVHVRDLARMLRADGHEASVVTGPPGPFTEQLAAAGIPCETLPRLRRSLHPVRDALALADMRRTLERVQPDLVTTHSSKAGWLGRTAARSLGLPVLFTAHGWAFAEGVPSLGRLIYGLAEKAAAPLASHIITVCEADRALALHYGIGRPEQITTIHNGILDFSTNDYAVPEGEPPRLAMVARFMAQKDHALLLRALSSLTDLAWSLDLPGEGPLRADVQQLARDLGLSDRVRFLGTRDDVARILGRAQAFVLASNWEGFPYSIVEAMRAGLPVVASDVGGVREAVSHGETGLVVPRGDQAALSDALGRLLADADMRRVMGAAGRARYEADFTVEAMYAKTREVYRHVLGAAALQPRGAAGQPRTTA